MTPANTAQLALKVTFVLAELLGELELAPAIDGPRSYAMDCTIAAGASLEGLVKTLRGIERRRKHLKGRSPKPATPRSRSRSQKKGRPVGEVPPKPARRRRK